MQVFKEVEENSQMRCCLPYCLHGIWFIFYSAHNTLPAYMVCCLNVLIYRSPVGLRYKDRQYFAIIFAWINTQSYSRGEMICKNIYTRFLIVPRKQSEGKQICEYKYQKSPRFLYSASDNMALRGHFQLVSSPFPIGKLLAVGVWLMGSIKNHHFIIQFEPNSAALTYVCYVHSTHTLLLEGGNRARLYFLAFRMITHQKPKPGRKQAAL